MTSTMNDKVELPELVLLSDEPTPDHDADGLGMRRYAEVIAGAALNTPGPFTIGVYGGWGEGKTSLLKQAKSLIERQAPEVTTVWFNAWQHDRAEHPMVPLVLAIADELERGMRSCVSVATCRDAGRRLFDAVCPRRPETEPQPQRRGPSRRGRAGIRNLAFVLRAIAHGVSLKAPGIGIDGGKILDALDRPSFLPWRWPLPTSVYQKAFNQLEDLARRAANARADALPIVVFIDDLDRCQPDKAVRVLQSIRLVLGQPGFVFVLALDREPIVCHLINEYRRLEMKDPEASGRAYLEKIVQLPLWVPSHQTEFTKYIALTLKNEAVKRSAQLCRTIEELTDVLAIGTEANPRSLVRLVNRLIAGQHLLADVLGEYDNGLGLLAVSRLLRSRLDLADYLDLVEDQSLCNELLQPGDGEEADARTKWREFAGVRPELRTPQQRLRVSLLDRLERTPSIERLLETVVGREWLAEREARLAIEKRLAVEPQERAESPADDETDAIDCAIRLALYIPTDTPIGPDHRERVTKLNLSRTHVTDAALAQLAELPSLAALNLSRTQVTDAGLAHLAGLTSLTELDLQDTEVTDAGLEHLAGSTSLTTLSLWNTEVTDAGLAHLKGLTSLETLNLTHTQMTDAGLAHLASLTSLKELRLWGPLTDAGLSHLAGLTSLTTLYLWYTQVTDAGLTHLAGLTSLTTLNLFGTRVTGAGLTHLAGLPSLTALYLGSTRVTDAAWEHITRLTALRNLSLGRTLVTDGELVHLAELPFLAHLDLSGTQLTDAGLQHLKALTSLATLDIKRTQVTDAGLEHLAGLTSLKSLNLLDTNVTEDGLNALKAANPDLRVAWESGH